MLLYDKSPCVSIFTNSWAIANVFALWSDRRRVEIWPIKGMPMWGTALRKSLREFEGCIKIRYINAHQ